MPADPAGPADLSDEMVLTTTDAARLLKAHRATVCEWLTKGVPIRGTTVRLRGEASGTRLRTSERAVAEFRRDCTAARLGKQTVELTPTQRQRQYDAEQRRVAALLK